MHNRLAEYDRALVPAAVWQPAGEPGEVNWQQRITVLTGNVSRWITEHPEIALATALTTGLVLGWLIKRR